MTTPLTISGITLQPKQEELFDLVKAHKFTMAYGVSRGGKSYVFFLILALRCLIYPGSKHAVIRQTYNSIDSTIWETVEKVIDHLDPNYRSKLDITMTPRKIVFDNGSSIWFLGAQDEEAVRKIMGAEFATIFLNEVVNFDFKTYGRILSRLNSDATDKHGSKIPLRLIADCNPETKGHWVYQQWCAKLKPGTEEPLFNPDSFGFLQFDRNANATVQDGYYDELQNVAWEDQQSLLYGEWRDEVQGALFARADLEKYREETPDSFDAVMVGSDPAATNSPTSDETGSIAVGCVHTELPDGTLQRDLYPLEDYSGKYHPNDWGRITTDLARSLNADAIIIETTMGGESMPNNLRNADPRANILTVNPGRGQGKNIRAIPIGAEMAKGRIHFPPTQPGVPNRFAELEAQMLSMTGDFDRKRAKSPDRLDAFVYACAELLSFQAGPSPVVTSKAVGFYR